MPPLTPACAETLFWLALLFNLRSVVKFLIDWHGLWATARFVREAYAAKGLLPSVEDIERDPGTPEFLHLVAAFHEPEIGTTLQALLSLRYPAERSRVVVVTKEEEDRLPHPRMRSSTGELIRRFRESLPLQDRQRLFHLVMPGQGRKAEQLNWALRPDFLKTLYAFPAADTAMRPFDDSRVFVTVSDADSIPDPDVCRWIVSRLRCGTTSVAFQGLPLAFANFERLPIRGRICALQQTSIYIRFCISRMLNEPARARLAERVRLFRGGAWMAPLIELFLRRSHICLGHNTILRLDALRTVGGFPTSGATEDSTLGYAIGSRGWLIEPSPMLELVELPETPEKVIRQNARWYLGVLDNVGFLWRAWSEVPSAYNLAQLSRHIANRTIEWPIALILYPLLGWVGWRLAWDIPHYRPILWLSIAAPVLSIGLTFWVCGLVIPYMLGSLEPFLPKPIDLRSRSWLERVLRVARCQSYWLLSTFGTWRVLATAAIGRRYVAIKTDRVAADAHAAAARDRRTDRPNRAAVPETAA